MASKKASCVLAADPADVLGQGRRGERAGGDDRLAPVGRRQAGHLLAHDASPAGSAASASVTAAAKPSRSTASAPPAGSLCRSPMAITSEPSRRISSCSRPTALPIASSERNEFEQTSSASRSVWCASVPAHRPHLVQHDRHAAPGQLPGGLAAGEAAADDVDG